MVQALAVHGISNQKAVSLEEPRWSPSLIRENKKNKMEHCYTTHNGHWSDNILFLVLLF